MKRLFFILFLVCGFTTTVNAQFYDKGYYLYIEADKTVHDIPMECSTGNAFLFNGKILIEAHWFKRDLLKAIREHEDYTIDFGKSQCAKYDYDDATSTSSYVVYKKKRIESYIDPYNPMTFSTREVGGYSYRAFSKDRNEMVSWYTTLESNEAHNLTYYKRVTPDDFKPKEENWIFLK